MNEQEQAIYEPLLASIKSHPHWRVLFYPTDYDAHRVDRGKELLNMVKKHKVSLRGWDYPHVDTKGQTLTTRESATSWSDFAGSREVWRMFRSGQFVHVFALPEEVPTFSANLARRFPRQEKPSCFLDIEIVVYTISEIYEFASRLASEGIYDSGLRVEIELHGARGRGLSSSDRRSLHNAYIASDPTITLSSSFLIEDLRGRTAELAVQSASDFFADFGAEFPLELIRDMQRGLGGYGR